MDNLFFNYEPKSLVKAIYIICSWPNNRTYIGLEDALNKALLSLKDNEKNSQEKINNYDDFLVFYQKLKDYIKNNPNCTIKEDFSVDIGQVKFFSNITQKYYSILIGNGSENAYENCFIAESIAEKGDELSDVWLEILKYEDLQCKILYKNGSLKIKNDSQRPSEEYFNNVNVHYDALYNDKLNTYFKGFESVNQELYPFFLSKDKSPLFFPMMKECFLEKVESENFDINMKNAVWKTIYERILKVFIQRKIIGDAYLLSPVIKHGNTSDETFKDGFFLFTENQMIFFYDDNICNDKIESLKEDLKTKRIEILGLTTYGKIRSVLPSKEISILFQSVDCKENSSNFSKQHSSNNSIYMDANSLISIINNSHSISEIVGFMLFKYQETSDRTINFSGIGGEFKVWQESDRVINEGSNSTNILISPYYILESTLDLFQRLKNYYPFDVDPLFSDPHHWIIVNDSDSDLSLKGKNADGMVEFFKYQNKVLIYNERVFIVDDMKKEFVETFNSFHEIIINGIKRNKKYILSGLSSNFNELELTSEQKLKENVNHLNKKISSSKYYDGAQLFYNPNFQVVLLTSRWDVILKDNLNEKKLKFENDLILGFLENFDVKGQSFLTNKIKDDDSEKRTSGINSMVIDYFIDSGVDFNKPRDSNFKLVRKGISEIINKLNIIPGIYKDSESVGIIRKFLNSLKDKLNFMINEYNFESLNINLLNIESAILFQIDQHRERLKVFEQEDSINNQFITSFKKKTANLRETSRQYQPVLEFLIEENLVYKNRNSERIPTKDELNQLIAFSKWIIDFQSLSDQANYDVTGWTYLDIKSDYIVDIKETKKAVDMNHKMMHLKYKYGDYRKRDGEIDNEFLKKFYVGFKKDTNINFEMMIAFLKLFSSNSFAEKLKKINEFRIYENVLKTRITVMAEFFVLNTDYVLEDFFQILDFVSIKDKLLVNKMNIIPIWEKKKRRNKISVQPIIINKDKAVFSPVMLDNLYKNWIDGIFNFTLPYQIGMNNSKTIINQWKKQYENKIVQDLVSLFKDERYDVSYNKEIYKYDKLGKHPRNLGDYDLIVVDKVGFKVILIEAKYMRLNQTMIETIEDQNTYFLDKRRAKAPKFDKRIRYFKKNVDEIMKNKGYVGQFKVEGYFIANKNIRSYYKNFSFPIMGFNEFKKEVTFWK